jgi:Transcriptional regulators
MWLTGRLENESAHDFALRLLKYNIVNLHFPPGSFISSHELAGKIGVSRTPLREAMQELERLALLKVFANAGSQISPINYQQLNELRFIRQTLDSAAAEAACVRITPADYFELEEMLRAQRHCLEIRQPDQLMEQDEKFHRRLYSLADMDTTYGIIEPFRCHFERFRRLNYSAQDDIRLVEEHEGLVEALKIQDKGAAQKIVSAHFYFSRKDEQVVLDQYPGYFADDYARADQPARVFESHEAELR